MDSLKESFTKGIATLNVKTNNFMEESKCKTYISTLEKEIANLKQEIGENVYKLWVAGDDITKGSNELLEQIKLKYDEIEVQKEKIKNLAAQEQQILGTGTQQPVKTNAQPVSQQEQSVVLCKNCGMQNVSTYKFCVKCGVSLNQ